MYIYKRLKSQRQLKHRTHDLSSFLTTFASSERGPACCRSQTQPKQSLPDSTGLHRTSLEPTRVHKITLEFINSIYRQWNYKTIKSVLLLCNSPERNPSPRAPGAVLCAEEKLLSPRGRNAKCTDS